MLRQNYFKEFQTRADAISILSFFLKFQTRFHHEMK